MTVESRDGTPVPSDTVEYGGMQIPVAPGEIVYGSKDVISEGGFSPRNPAYTDGDGVRREYPERLKIPH